MAVTGRLDRDEVVRITALPLLLEVAVPVQTHLDVGEHGGIDDPHDLVGAVGRYGTRREECG